MSLRQLVCRLGLEENVRASHQKPCHEPIPKLRGNLMQHMVVSRQFMPDDRTMCLGFLSAGHEVTLIAAEDYRPVRGEKYDFPILWFHTVCRRLFMPRCFPYMPGIRRFLRNHKEYDIIVTSEVFATWSFTAARRINHQHLTHRCLHSEAANARNLSAIFAVVSSPLSFTASLPIYWNFMDRGNWRRNSGRWRKNLE